MASLATSSALRGPVSSQFGGQSAARANKALRRRGGGGGVRRGGRSPAATPVAWMIPNLIPNPNYRWGESVIASS